MSTSSKTADNRASASLVDAVREGLGNLGLPHTEEAVLTLSRYVELLAKWNRVYNLTAVRDTGQMVPTHILDSASVIGLINSARSVLDVGTGAGLPGIPLAVLSPGLSVTMLDTVTKKTAFVRQAINELGISNASVVTERVEKYLPPARFDVVISRAFSELEDFVKNAGHLVASGGRMLAMKGQYPNDEISRVPAPFRVVDVHMLRVPGLDAQRHLVVIEKS